MFKIRDIFVTLIALVGLFTIMQSHAQTNSTDSKAALEQRVTQYWAARQARDARTVYDMESAARPGGWLTPDKAMGTVAGLPVKNVKIDEMTIEGDRGKVKVSANVLVGSLGWVPQSMVDQWVLIEGQWYHQTQR